MITNYKVKLPNNPTLKDFIKFFKAIPANEWCIKILENSVGQRCANGHINASITGGNGIDWPFDYISYKQFYPSSIGAPDIVAYNNAEAAYGISYNGKPIKNPNKGIKTRVINYLKKCLKEQETKKANDTLGTSQAKG